MKTIQSLKLIPVSFSLLAISLVGLGFLASSCGDVAVTCDTTKECPPGSDLDLESCECECLKDFVKIGGDCVLKSSLENHLEADITGQDITGTFHYDPNDVDIEFLGDSLIVDGYIDHIEPEKSSHIYIRVVRKGGGILQANQRYDLSQGVGNEHNIATQRYPFTRDNEYYAIDTGSIYIKELNMNTGVLDAEFSFSCSTGKLGEIRWVKNGIVKTAAK